MISNFRVLRVNVKLFDILHRQAMYLFYKNRFKITHVREWSKFVEDLQHLSVTTEQNFRAQITAEKRPGNGVECSFLKYPVLTFCWPTKLLPFVRWKWFKNVKPAFSLLSPPFSYRQFIMRSTGMIATDEFYWYFNNFCLLFAWEMKRANEKRILILISGFLG